MKPTHYAYRNSAGGVYVKEAEFFEEQGGKTKGWGSRWRPVIARDLAHARLIAETYAGELRWPMGAREQPPLRDELDKAVTVEGHLALSRHRMREAALRGSSSKIAEAKEVPGVKSHADYSGLEDRLLAGYIGAPYPETPSWPGGTVTGRFEVGPDMQTIKKKRAYSSPSITVPPGQTPLDDDLTHPILDVINQGIKARTELKSSPYHGHSLEHCLHAVGWVQRDMQLALLRRNERSVDPWTRQAGNELIEALKEWTGEMHLQAGERCPDGTPRLGKWEAENLYRKANAFLKLISE